MNVNKNQSQAPIVIGIDHGYGNIKTASSCFRTSVKAYVEGIFRKLREHEYNPDLMKLYVIGGGGCLIRNFGKFEKDRVKINDDICATAKGYEFLTKLKMKQNGGKL